MNALEERLAALEELVATLCDRNDIDSKIELTEKAKVQALYTLVQDLAVEVGVTAENFLKHYETRFRWWHDYYLRQAEDISPAIAAELDTRTVVQADVSPTYPSLFDQPPQD